MNLPFSFLPPGGAPGTMPGAVPGGIGTPIPAAPGLPARGVSLPPGAVPGIASAFLPPGTDEPAKYEAVTQADGSVLLHLKNPDGSLGPAVKIIAMAGPKKPQV